MQAGLQHYLAKPVSLVLTGPGAGTLTIDPGATLTVIPAGPDATAAAVIESSAHEFTAWSTTRLPWREHTTVTGDEQTAATFLDALNLI